MTAKKKISKGNLIMNHDLNLKKVFARGKKTKKFVNKLNAQISV